MSTIASKKQNKSREYRVRLQKNSLNILTERRQIKIRINLKKKGFFRDIVNSKISNLIICHSIANDVNAVNTQQRGNC